MAREQRKLAAILATDVIGYSRLMGRDESGTLARLRGHRKERLEPALARYGGRLVKLTGDGALVEFASAVDALSAAIEFQQAVAEANSDRPADDAFVFRMGLHLGDLIVDGDDLYGDGVNIAARLEAEAPAGGIVISRSVHEAVAGRVKATFDDLGSLALKNIERPVQAFCVKWKPSDWKLPSEDPVAPATAPTAPLPLPDKPSIAVLPFQNMSADPEQEYFIDGLVEDIVTALSRVKWLFVIARNSSFIYKGRSVDVRQVGRDLGVRYVLEGSIRKAAARIRLTAQLIDASSGDHLWADRYEGGLDEIFELQDQVVGKLIGAIEPKLRVAEIARSHRKRSENLDAFDLMLQALPKFTSMTREGLADAIELLDRAIKLEPTYAQALGYAAWCRATRSFYGVSPDPAGDFREASLLVQRALDADPEDPIALRAAAVTVVIVRKDYQGGLDLVERSLDIDSNSAASWGVRGWINVWAGEWKDALGDFEKGLRLSPFDLWCPSYWVGMASCLIQANRFEEALRWARKALQRSPRWGTPYRSVATCLVLLGRLDEARAVAKEYLKLEPDFTLRRYAEATPFRQTPTQKRTVAALKSAGLPE
jgi:TolB-like protein/class 3 adenylate cyclase